MQNSKANNLRHMELTRSFSNQCFSKHLQPGILGVSPGNCYVQEQSVIAASFPRHKKFELQTVATTLPSAAQSSLPSPEFRLQSSSYNVRMLQDSCSRNCASSQHLWWMIHG